MFTLFKYFTVYANILGHVGATQVDKRRAAHAFEGKKEAMILEGKIHRKVPHYHPQHACQLADIAGRETNSDDCGVWRHVGGGETADCRKFEQYSKLVNHSFKIGT